MPRMGGSAGARSLLEEIILREIRLLQSEPEKPDTEQDDLFDMMDMVLYELKGGPKRAKKEKKTARYYRKRSVWRKPLRRVWRENAWPWVKRPFTKKGAP